MELDETGVPLIASGVGGDDPFDDLIGEPDPELDDSATVAGGNGGVTGDEVISVDSEDNGGVAGAGAGTYGVESRTGVMDTEGLQVARVGTLSNDTGKDPNTSEPIHADEDAMSDNESETDAAANATSNTTVTKSIAMLNATIMASVWSLADQIPCTIVTTSVAAFLWRKTKPYKSPLDIETAISGLPEVWALSSPSLPFSPSLSVSALTESVSTIAQKKQPWTNGPLTCDLFTILLALSKTPP